MLRSELIPWTLSWVLTYALHSTVLLGLAWLAARTIARGSLRLRETLWKTALVGGIATASMQVGADVEPLAGRLWVHAAGPNMQQPLEPSVPARDTFEEPQPVEATWSPAEDVLASAAGPLPIDDCRTDCGEDLGATPAIGASIRNEPEREPERRSEGAPVARLDTEPRISHPAPAALVERPRIDWAAIWPDILLALWLIGGLSGLSLLAWAWARIADRIAGREELRDGPLFDELQELCRRSGMRRAPRLCISTRLSSPATIGVLRPQICVPRRALDELGPEHREALLAHELAHVARRDPQWSFLGRAIERALFFQPLNRVARRQLSEIAEYQADDWAVQQTGRSVCLARCLAEVAGWVLERRPVVGLLPMAESGSQLGRRIRRLLEGEEQPRRASRSAWMTPLAVSSLFVVTPLLPGATAGVRATEEEEALEEVAPPELELIETPAEEVDDSPPHARLAADIATLIEALDLEVAQLLDEVDALAETVESQGLEASFSTALSGVAQQVSSLREKKERLERMLPAVLELVDERTAESEQPGTQPRASLRDAQQGDPRMENR